MITAWCGRSTRVETTVAIEFGASVHPFANSNEYARIKTSQSGIYACFSAIVSSTSDRSSTSIDRRLHLVADVAQLEHVERAVVAAEQVRDRLSVHAVALVLEAIDLDRVRGELLVLGEQLQRLPHRLRRADQDVRLDLHLRQGFLDLVEHEEVRRRLHVVQDVVQARRPAYGCPRDRAVSRTRC